MITGCNACTFSSGVLICSNCLSNFELNDLNNSICDACTSVQAYDWTSMTCKSCNYISNCHTCLMSGGTMACLTCEINHEKVGNTCVRCATN